MIKLAELMHVMRDEQDEGLVPVDNWRATHAMYLEDMGFKNDGMYYYALKKPDIRLSHKKNEGFIVEDKDNEQKHTFLKFKELEEFFANYKQKWDNAPYQDANE